MKVLRARVCVPVRVCMCVCVYLCVCVSVSVSESLKQAVPAVVADAEGQSIGIPQPTIGKPGRDTTAWDKQNLRVENNQERKAG